jgi:AcrR family transcriptional regulator
MAKVDDDKARDKLLRAAEVEFFQKGFSGASIRTIAAKAGVNSALIAYYFGGKDELFRVVFQTATAPMNRRRMDQFDALEAAGNYRVEDVLHAWIRPIFEPPFINGSRPSAVLSFSLGEEQHDLLMQLISESYGEACGRFLQLMEKILPSVSRETLARRLFFVIGAVMTSMRVQEKSFRNFSLGQGDTADLEFFVSHLVNFAAAGFQAKDPDAP